MALIWGGNNKVFIHIYGNQYVLCSRSGKSHEYDLEGTTGRCVARTRWLNMHTNTGKAEVNSRMPRVSCVCLILGVEIGELLFMVCQKSLPLKTSIFPFDAQYCQVIVRELCRSCQLQFDKSIMSQPREVKLLRNSRLAREVSVRILSSETGRKVLARVPTEARERSTYKQFPRVSICLHTYMLVVCILMWERLLWSKVWQQTWSFEWMGDDGPGSRYSWSVSELCFKWGEKRVVMEERCVLYYLSECKHAGGVNDLSDDWLDSLHHRYLRCHSVPLFLTVFSLYYQQHPTPFPSHIFLQTVRYIIRVWAEGEGVLLSFAGTRTSKERDQTQYRIHPNIHCNLV